jgi:hypothetical protein
MVAGEQAGSQAMSVASRMAGQRAGRPTFWQASELEGQCLAGQGARGPPESQASGLNSSGVTGSGLAGQRPGMPEVWKASFLSVLRDACTEA